MPKIVLLQIATNDRSFHTGTVENEVAINLRGTLLLKIRSTKGLFLTGNVDIGVKHLVPSLMAIERSEIFYRALHTAILLNGKCFPRDMVRKNKKVGSEKLFPAEEQGILPDKSKSELRDDIEKGEHDEDVLTTEGRDALVENDEVESWEAGFAEGASEEGQLGKDALTGEPLMDVDDVVEAEVKGKTYRFVSEKNAKEFRRKHEVKR